MNTNFNLVNLLLGAQRHLHKYSPSLTEVLFSLPDDGQSLDRIILELKLDYLYKNSSISSLGVMLADAIINNYSDQQESSFLNTLISLLQAIENANSAILDSTICPSLQVYTKALCSQLRQADKHDSNIHSILLTGASSLLDIFLNQFDFLIRYASKLYVSFMFSKEGLLIIYQNLIFISIYLYRLDDVADRVSVLHHTGYVLSSTDLNMNMEEYADLPESTGLWYIWRLQTVSTTIIDSYFNADTGSTRAAINTDFETLLETTRQLSMLSTALQLNQTSSNEHLTNWIDAFQLSHKTFRSFQSKYSDNGFNVPVDPVGFLTVTARYSEKFSLNKWIFSASSSFCASSLVTDTLRQSAAVQLPDAIKAIK